MWCVRISESVDDLRYENDWHLIFCELVLQRLDFLAAVFYVIAMYIELLFRGSAMPLLEIAAGKIHYEVWQDPTATGWVTLLGGHTRTTSDFKIFAEKIRRKHFNVLAIDFRGFGQTQMPSPFTLADLACDVVAVWQALAVDKSHVLGISMGGMVAQELCREHLDRLASLTLVSTMPDIRFFSVSDQEWPKSLDLIQEKLRYYFAPQFYAQNKLLLEAMAKGIERTIRDGDFLVQAKAQRLAIQDFIALTPSPSYQALPCLVIHGEEDLIASKDAASAFVDIFPEAEIHLLPKVGHLILAEDNASLLRLFSNFLAS